MNRLNNYIYYLLIIGLLAAGAFFFHSYMLAAAAIAFILLPLFSFALLRLSFGRIHIDLKDNSERCKRNKEYKLKITLRNKSLMPALNFSFKLELLNDFGEQGQERYINASVPALGKREVILELKPTLCGRINIRAGSAEVRDIMSFFKAKSREEARLMINVMPRRLNQPIARESCENTSDESERAHKDSAGMDIIDIREYMQGDSLKTVHWKLSAKNADDELYVRERGDSTIDKALLLFELKREEINGILDIVYTAARRYIKEGLPLKVCWAGSGDEQLRSFTVYEERNIYPLFERVYSSVPSSVEEHTLSVAKRQLTGGSAMYIGSGEEGIRVVRL